eukprot:TRINITY_DN26541_c0_g1_i1.p1 TRINITY_DN26541_c0_g1~~TRINITY_DN26541_c0_g1_i1.p1  ORF type:complete len:484 (+),score=133.61 TRINITY_DN26541_c0_g1_i1:95-1546(+)
MGFPLVFGIFISFLWFYGAFADYTTTIQPKTTWGQWDGWGCALAWMGNVYGAREDLADLLFTLNDAVALQSLNGTLPGLGLTIARYNVGGCSWNTIGASETMVASPNIPHWKQMQGFWLDPTDQNPLSASWNWTVDSNQRALLANAKLRGATHLQLFSNSPMWWMLLNRNPSGSADGSSDNLAPAFYADFAVYLATVARYASDHWGFAFDTVEAFNEPIADWWHSDGTQEGCHFDHSTQATVIALLRAELDAVGLNGTRIAASDESTYSMALGTWKAFNSTTHNLVDQVDVHGYEYGGGRRDLLYQAVDGKRLWNSEYGEGDASGLSLASNLNLDFRWLHPTAWCYWQPLDGGGWGLVQADPSTASVSVVNTKHFVLAQYTRHIRPGMTIIDGGESNTVAAYDTESATLVIVTTNYAAGGQRVTYDLSNFNVSVAGPVIRWATNTGGGERYTQHNDTVITGTEFSSWFAQNTVQTFEVSNIFL